MTEPALSTPNRGSAAPAPRETQGDLELEERSSLRRVAGLSTELTDVTEVEYRQLRLERVVLVGVWTEGTAEQARASMTELARLAETAGSEVLDALMQRRPRPDPATFIGSGKVDELRDAVHDAGADTVICDGELSPGQLRQLEEKLKVKVIDRTALILDIFAQHARSRDGKAQVELAQLSYLLPRLRGWGEALSRQVGGRAAGGVGIGGRGPGETKIELDRRRIRSRMSKLRREIAAMRQVRETQRGDAAPPRGARRSRSSATPTPASPACSTRSPAPGCWSRTRCSPPSTRPPAGPTPPTGAPTPSPTPSGSSGTCPTSSSRRSAPPWRRPPTPTCWCTSSTPPTRCPRSRSRRSARCWSRSARTATAPCRAELLVVNKTDAAGDLQLARLRHLLPERGVRLRARRRRASTSSAPASPSCCPRPEVDVELLRALRRGCRSWPACTREGEVLAEEHTPEGTRHARPGRRRAGLGGAARTRWPAGPDDRPALTGAALIAIVLAGAAGAGRRGTAAVPRRCRWRRRSPRGPAAPSPTTSSPSCPGWSSTATAVVGLDDSGRRVELHRWARPSTRTTARSPTPAPSTSTPTTPRTSPAARTAPLWVADTGDNDAQPRRPSR